MKKSKNLENITGGLVLCMLEEGVLLVNKSIIDFKHPIYTWGLKRYGEYGLIPNPECKNHIELSTQKALVDSFTIGFTFVAVIMAFGGYSRQPR